MPSAPPYVLPLRVRPHEAAFAVEDANEIALAYVYFEDEPSRRALVKQLRRDDARAVAQAIARALTEAAKPNTG